MTLLKRFRYRRRKQFAKVIVQQLVTSASKIVHSLREPLKALFDEEAKNIERQRQRAALAETADYVDEYLSAIESSANKFELLEKAIALSSPKEGLFLEFGVFEGETINFIAEHVNTTIHGFDSFEGLPEFWRDGHGEGTFKCKIPNVRQNVQLHKGYFIDSLPQWLLEHSGPISFIHIDCDLYSSTQEVLNLLRPRITPQTVIVFDEYFNYPGWKYGEYKAFKEFIADNDLSYKYVGYNRYHEQVAVQLC